MERSVFVHLVTPMKRIAPSLGVCNFLDDESASLVPVFFLRVHLLVVVVLLPEFQLFCSMTAA